MSFGEYYGRNFDCQEKKTTTDDGKGLKYLSISEGMMGQLAQRLMTVTGK